MTTLKQIISGEILKDKFFKKNIKYIILIFSLFFVFVIVGAIGAFKVGEKEELKKEIIDLKEDAVYISADLMHRSLVFEVKKEVKKRNIDLEQLSKPPAIIEIKTDKK